MKTHNDLIQGSAEWHAHRARHWNASDCPAMLGCSPYETRQQLLHRMHTGITPEVDAGTQRRFDDGHRFEALARGLAEELIGDDLAPIVGTEGELSASFDGITFMGDTVWEHKTLGEALRYTPWDEGNGDHLPKHYRAQMEQQLMVSGAERVLFMATKWSADGELIEERHCWYASDPALRREIIAGWTQFAVDLATYTPPAAEPPKPAGHAPESLPALRIEVTGLVTASNLDAFKAHALAVFAGINRTLTTDAEFADAEKTVKWCTEVEDRLKAAKQHALSQTESIDALFRTIDDIGAEARAVRLELDKLVKARKEAVRGELVAAGVKALAEHIAGLNKRLGHPWMPQIPADFGGKVKGLRTVQSIRDAVDGEVARVKIAANEMADRIQMNIAAIPDAESPFPLVDDFAVICTKPHEDFKALMDLRVRQHRERVEAERERIRREEAARVEREAQERAAAERRQQEAAAAAERAAQAAAVPPAPAPTYPPAAPAQALATGPANVVPMPTKAPAAPATPPTLKLGQIAERLGFTVTADFLQRMGFPPAATDKSAKLYHESQFGAIVDSIIAHLRMVQQQQRAA